MATNKAVSLPAVALTTTTTANIYNPPTLTAGTNPPEGSTNTYIVIRHIRVINTTNAAIRFALWRNGTGANTAGKEFAFAGTATAGALDANVGTSVAANSFAEWFGMARIQANGTDAFIVGGASATGLTVNAEGEIGIV